MSKVLAILAGFAMIAAADNVTPLVPQSTQAPIGARYEIVRFTPMGDLRLDRFTGKVAQSSTTSMAVAWSDMEVPGLPATSGDLPRFQITYQNGYDQSFLLLDTQTGMTWQLERDDPKDYRNRNYHWRKFGEDATAQ